MKIYPSNEKPYVYIVNNEDVIVQVNSGSWNKFCKHNIYSFEGCFSHSIIGESIWTYIQSIEVQKLYKIVLSSVRKHKTTIQIPFRCDSSAQRRFLNLEVRPLDHGFVEFKSQIVCVENRKEIPLFDENISRTNEYITMCSMCKSIRRNNTDWVEPESYFEYEDNNEFSCPNLFHSICSNCFENVLDKIENSINT